jgi:HD-like signal output (HDOD) protein/CheY-like chemotaxis protein
VTSYNVLFVDDDENMLAGLQRLLRPLRHEWHMHFVSSAAAALDALKHESFHAIVTDMRMPDMDGGALLQIVSRRHPEMVRLILSGHSESESVMRTVGPAHQFLAKPCAPQLLIEVLKRSIALRKMLGSESLHRLVAGIRNLPTPPATYFSLIHYLGDPKASFNGAAAIIERDVAMTAELLKLTNSAYFSLPARVSSPLQAIRMLGFETLRGLVLQIGIFQQFRGKAGERRMMEAVNRDSFRVAHLARFIATLEGLEPAKAEECFCAGMLCSIGALVLLDCLPDRFSKVRAAVSRGTGVSEAERTEFGATRFQVGAYLLGLWGFLGSIVEAVAYADCPRAVSSQGFEVMAVVHAARALAGPFPDLAMESGEAGTLALDLDYLAECGKRERVEMWRAEVGKI